MIMTNDYFYTHDLGLATAISIYFPLEAIDRSNPAKAEFLFKKEEGFDQIIEAFWQRQLQIDALTYFNQLKIIKSRLYEGGLR
jgi:hypothetical protein